MLSLRALSTRRVPQRTAAHLTVLAQTVSLLLVLLPAAAVASEAKPLAITKFAMQTTAPTKVVMTPHPSELPSFDFINEPSVFTQAGGHPWALTTTLEFASEEIESSVGRHLVVPTRDPKDTVVSLPPGLLGDPVAVPRCPLASLTSEARCPAATQVGEYRIRWHGGSELLAPIVNMTPEAGQSAEFALETAFKIEPILTAHLVRAENPVTKRFEYGFTVTSNEIPSVGFYRIELTFWGVPADPSHDPLRGLFCGTTFLGAKMTCSTNQGPVEGALEGVPSGVSPVPFLSLPTSCAAGAETGTVRADSWQEPGSVGVNGRYVGWQEASAVMPPVTGCDRLSFAPSIEVQPDTLLADAPVGLGVNVLVPQPEEPGVSATPHLRDAVVTLPPGMSISPGIVDGIQACDAEGPEGINFDGPESELVGLSGEWELAPGKCPDASTVGEAEAITPLLPEPVKGHVYLARPGCGGAGQSPCSEQDTLDGNLYQLYLELGGKGPLGNTGIVIKVPGFVEANPATGQLTTKFLENPQTPFSELKIRLNGGPRAPLDNPPACGAAVTTADFTPWSTPGITPEGVSVAGTPDAAVASRPFNVEGCLSPTPFAPGFSAGTVSPQAGQFSSFTMNLTRHDREQYVKGIQVHTPPGLVGMLSSVSLCEESLADSGHCPEASRIGTTTVASGAGSHPFEISGTVYLTRGYGGAPFGLSIVTDAVAGPFNLGLVVVRARIAVDPTTSALTITTDEAGPHAIPQIVFGVPLRLKQITVNIDRPGFMFNPTNCSAQQATATVSGSGQALASVVSPFAAGGCKSLDFKPQFTVSTSGRTSKQNGASLDAKVIYPPFKAGSEANIASVKVALPKQLPSRLTTLQKACTAAQFDANPAGCPQASVVGIVKASTPVLPVTLTGPVYFVSHGGEAFPSLVIVLQGDGVRVDLTGSTFISRAGITSSTFKAVPDVPVTTFELYLPQGPYSALAANTNLCALTTTTVKRNVTRHIKGHTVHRTLTTHVKKPSGLVMPTEMIAQNGATIHQNTPITITNCTAGKAKRSRAHGARHKTQASTHR
jgi:hypothetical protein